MNWNTVSRAKKVWWVGAKAFLAAAGGGGFNTFF
jgi:hypothetical protein